MIDQQPVSATIKPKLTRSDDDIKAIFYTMTSKADVADLLEIPLNRLLWHLHFSPVGSRYRLIQIPKKAGGNRVIEIPVTALKIIQEKLNHILQLAYSEHKKKGVHGFSLGTSIVTNAQAHQKSKLLLNLGLLDFFPSISFGRVRGIFQRPPYQFNREVATVLAQICCHNKKLPQGAPTSPIVSNIVCAKLDVELKRLASSGGSTYSRYADDITFSTSRDKFLRAIVTVSEQEIEPGADLTKIIQQNGFRINQKKVWYRSAKQTKTVTGLTIHTDRLNVSRQFYQNLRQLLHCWKHLGYDVATKRLLASYRKSYPPKDFEPNLENVLRGRIGFFGMVRGHNDAVYQKYLTLFEELLERDCH